MKALHLLALFIVIPFLTKGQNAPFAMIKLDPKTLKQISIKGCPNCTGKIIGPKDKVSGLLRNSNVMNQTCNALLHSQEQLLDLMESKEVDRASVPDRCRSAACIEIDNPADFKKIYHETHLMDQGKRCSGSAEICLNTNGEASFTYGCEEFGSITISTSGSITISNKGPNGTTRSTTFGN